MLVRHADPARDGSACAEIYGPFVTDSAVSFEQQAPSAQEFSRRIELISRTHPWLVAQDADTDTDADADAFAVAVAGYAYACPHRERAAYRWAADVAVYVAEGHRRRGVGRALYGALLPLLARQGLRIACAGITLPNHASVALHESLGFEPVGVYRRIGWKGGAWHDVGWWQAELLSPGDGPPPDPGPPVRLRNP